MTTLVIAEHDNVTLKPVTLNAVTAAALLGGEVHVLVAGYRASAVATAAARITGVDKVLHVDDITLAHPVAENMTEQVLALSAPYSHIVFSATASGKNIAPRVAARLDVGQISDITRVISPNTFERPIYAGNAIATVQSTDATCVMTVRSTCFMAATQTGQALATTENRASVAVPGHTMYVSQDIIKNDRPELGAAKVVVSGGRALGSVEHFNALMTPLADKLGAAVGASRAAVDAGYAPNDWQVGQTGKIVAPNLYIAIGISGAIQHLTGMKDSRVIVAINKDPDAPIFKVADYGLVADLFVAVPELMAALDELKME
jgi:electron transfer flavoprotein alpha subunit